MMEGRRNLGEMQGVKKEEDEGEEGHIGDVRGKERREETLRMNENAGG